MQSPLTLQVIVGTQVVAVLTTTQINTVNRRRSTLSVTFTIPPVSTDGYVTLNLINPLGGIDTFNGFYMTNNCPTVGFYGLAGSCKSCPAIATCPGGDRLWPIEGYWSPNEQTMPTACSAPTSRCAGGKGSPCAPAYSGDHCIDCATNYEYQISSGICIACPTTGCAKSDPATYGYNLNGGEIATISFAYILVTALIGLGGFLVYKKYYGKYVFSYLLFYFIFY